MKVVSVLVSLLLVVGCAQQETLPGTLTVKCEFDFPPSENDRHVATTPAPLVIVVRMTPRTGRAELLMENEAPRIGQVTTNDRSFALLFPQDSRFWKTTFIIDRYSNTGEQLIANSVRRQLRCENQEVSSR